MFYVKLNKNTNVELLIKRKAFTDDLMQNHIYIS